MEVSEFEIDRTKHFGIGIIICQVEDQVTIEF